MEELSYLSCRKMIFYHTKQPSLASRLTFKKNSLTILKRPSLVKRRYF
jgi:hypothetical protein